MRRRTRAVAAVATLTASILSLCVAAALVGPRSARAVAERDRDRFDTVVIDAGHGGEDEGARGPAGSSEKDVVLDVARRLADRLRRQGLRVVLTRTSDAHVPLEMRTARANDARADLFISIHANAARTPDARGIETYFLSQQASDAEAGALAERENRAFRSTTRDPSLGDDPFLSVLGDMMATEHQMESDEFSRLVHRELARLERSPDRGVKQAPFVVLMGLQMPASLLEVGFITNPADARWLGSPTHRDEIARAIARAVRAFGERYDARRGRTAVPEGG